MELTWITNNPKSVKNLWPRRFGVEYIEGAPKATDIYSVEELRAQNIIGVYVNINKETYNRLPLIKSPKIEFCSIELGLGELCDYFVCPDCQKDQVVESLERIDKCHKVICLNCDAKYIAEDYRGYRLDKFMKIDKK